MPQRPDVPCAQCGTLMWRGTGSLPEGRAVCVACRRRSPRGRSRRPCPDCGQLCTGSRCRTCYNDAQRQAAPQPRKYRATDARNTQAWRRLKDQVVREEPTCWLRLPCCTGWSETADHVLTVSARPDLIMERANLRGACRACNNSRKDKPIEQLGIGMPTASTGWVL